MPAIIARSIIARPHLISSHCTTGPCTNIHRVASEWRSAGNIFCQALVRRASCAQDKGSIYFRAPPIVHHDFPSSTQSPDRRLMLAVIRHGSSVGVFVVPRIDFHGICCPGSGSWKLFALPNCKARQPVDLRMIAPFAISYV